MTPRRVLVTGAAGEIGRALRAGIHGRYPALRVSDIAAIDPLPGEEVVPADLERYDQVLAAMQGVDAVVHLGGIANEHTWERIAAVNIDGTAHVYEAARAARVGRVVFASSVHAVGFAPRSERVGPSSPTRPDTFYGVSKVAGEALARLYYDKFGVRSACVRICSYQERPRDRRHLSTWLSPGDMVRLVVACLETPALGCTILAGTSRNTRRWMSDEGWAEVGYDPQDDAEAWAGVVEHLHGPDDDVAEHVQGGFFAARDYRGLARD